MAASPAYSKQGQADAGPGLVVPPVHAKQLKVAFVRGICSAKATVSAAFGRVMLGRMRSALSGLSDRQLAEIGICRADIPAHAEWLLSGAAEDAGTVRATG